VLGRILGLVVLLGIGAVAVYALRARPGASPSLGAVAHGVSSEARELGSGAKELGGEAMHKLSEWGQGLQDAKVTASVRTALGLNARLRPYSFEVDTKQGEVTLQGRVDDQELGARAEAIAAAVPGVTRVVNQLEVGKPAGAAGKPSLTEKLGDKTVEMRVRLALSLNRALEGSRIQVSAQRGQVVLSGEANSQAQKEAALQTVRETDSVDVVFDRIQIAGAAADSRANLTPAQRATLAQRALDSNASLAGFHLSVREEAGRLVMRGTVNIPAEKDLAGLLARDGAGTSVENAIEIRPTAS
jgi:osmotically-inducible protein OsmY